MTNRITRQKHQVCVEFEDKYYYHLAHLIVLYDLYDFKWLTNKDGKFSFKRENIETQNEYFYGFCKACRKCNIRTIEQLEDERTSKKEILKDYTVNLRAYLYPAKKIHQFSKKEIKEFEKKLDIGMVYENRLNWIIEHGVILNFLSEKSLPDYVEAKNVKKYLVMLIIITELY